MTPPVYDRISHDYDVTRRADPYITSRFLAHLAINPQRRYLDLACGTGNYTIALSRFGGAWNGVDVSLQMLCRAHLKSPEIAWHCADASFLPYPNSTFAGVSCILALHHMNNLRATLHEIQRVLSNGRFVVFTSTQEQMRNYWLNEYFPEAMRRSIKQMPSFSELHAAFSESGFTIDIVEPYHVREDLEDRFLYSGKHCPSLYLDATVRSGISTFSVLAPEDEVVVGIERLRSDIQTGRFQNDQLYVNSKDGDYCFLVATTRQKRY